MVSAGAGGDNIKWRYAMSGKRRARLLKVVLLAAGIMMLAAFAAMVMPRAQMAWMHQWLGLGQFPDAPIAEYLARLTSGLYGLLGVLLLICTRDVRRHSAIIRALAVGIAALAVAGLVYGWLGGMPLWWLWADAATAGGFAIAVLWLQAGLGVNR